MKYFRGILFLYKLDRSHKALLLLASVVLKSFLMAIVSSYVFCGSINPYVLFFHCINNVPFVGVTIAAVALLGAFLDITLQSSNHLIQYFRI